MTAYGFNRTTGKMEVYYISGTLAAAWYTQASASTAFTIPA
jgi:hypothetical protein